MRYVVHYNVTEFAGAEKLAALKADVERVFETSKVLFIPTNNETRIEVYP